MVLKKEEESVVDSKTHLEIGQKWSTGQHDAALQQAKDTYDTQLPTQEASTSENPSRLPPPPHGSGNPEPGEHQQ